MDAGLILTSDMLGDANTGVALEFPGGSTVTAIATSASVINQSLNTSVKARSLIKVSHIILTVSA